jgi:hypothetical protein
MIGNQPSLTGNVASKSISVTATAGQTLFTVTGGYRVNQLDVYKNGVCLIDSSDYNARDGASVTLLSAANANDVIEFRVFDTFRASDAVNVNDSTVNFAGNLGVGGNLSVGGTVTAAYFSGNGSQLTYVDAGFGIPVNDTDNLFNYVSAAGTVTANLVLDTTNAGVNSSYVFTATPTITVSSGIGVTVQTGKTLVIDVLRLDP